MLFSPCPQHNTMNIVICLFQTHYSLITDAPGPTSPVLGYLQPQPGPQARLVILALHLTSTPGPSAHRIRRYHGRPRAAGDALVSSMLLAACCRGGGVVSDPTPQRGDKPHRSGRSRKHRRCVVLFRGRLVPAWAFDAFLLDLFKSIVCPMKVRHTHSFVVGGERCDRRRERRRLRLGWPGWQGWLWF